MGSPVEHRNRRPVSRPGISSRTTGHRANHRPPALARALALLLVLTRAAEARAQEDTPHHGLSSQVVDPTAPLKTILLQDRWSPSFWGMDAWQNEVTLQLAVPFAAFGAPNILRVTVPYVTAAPEGPPGVSEVAVFDIVVVPAGSMKVAVGAVASLSGPRGEGVDTYAMGPAVGVVIPRGAWTFGLFSQNLFSGEDIATTQLQPVAAYTVDERLSFALGDAQYTIDWNEGGFVLVPLSLQGNYILHVAGQPVRVFANPQYNLKDEPGARKWILTAGLALIAR